MEGRFGADFSDVRVHTDAAARASAAGIGARAYTVGDHVVIGDGGTDKHTFAHELTHVIQQRQGPVGGTSRGRGLKLSDPSDVFEKAAEANALRVVRAPLGEHRQAPAGSDEKRVAGDVASAGHVPSRGNGAGPSVATVQRLVGFEAEFSVPTMPPPPRAVTLGNGPSGQAATPEVEGFLTGGLPYDFHMGSNDSFTLKPDHNDLQQKQLDIRERLEKMGYRLPRQPLTISNLEYVTFALDELAPNSTTAFKAQFRAITNHAKSLFPQVLSTPFAIPAPAADYWTGIPLADLQSWLGSDYPQVQAQVEDYIANIRNEFDPQATAGIIPSALADLHKSRVPQFIADTVFEEAAEAVHKAVRSLLRLPGFATHPFVVALRARHQIDYDALVGLLYLTFSYMVGSALNQTTLLEGKTPKSSVPFLSKMTDLSYVINLAAPTKLRDEKVPTDLVSIIQGYFNASPYATLDYWLNAGWGLEKDPGGRKTISSVNFVAEVLSGSGPARTSAATKPGHAFSEPDVLPDRVSAASGGQSGAQVEYRHLMVYPSTATLAAELMKVVKEVRNLNTRHLGFWARRAILKAADR